jgi:Mn-dependent DtxR family transcriptional regulator
MEIKMRKRTIEEYAEAIYITQKIKKRAQTNDIAELLNVNPASVTEMFQKLSDQGYIKYIKYTGVTLTNKGKKIAIKTKNKHDTLKNFLMVIGIDEKTADEDACKIEHNVNPKTMQKLRKFVEFTKIENGCSRWLDHFKYYYETGNNIKCQPSNKDECPVHR